jgi:hypothetical protein
MTRPLTWTEQFVEDSFNLAMGALVWIGLAVGIVILVEIWRSYRRDIK